MDSTIVCPLCSQPGFPDVDSLWLTLIRASTRQLACPVCQEVLIGLDKLTIHLVSHSLHGHLVRACLASNLASTSVTPDKVQTNATCEAALLPEANTQVPIIDNQVNPSVSSYILVNFPTSEKSLAENSCEVPGSSNEVLGNTDIRDREAASDSSQELDFMSLLRHTNSSKATSVSNQVTATLPQNVKCTDDSNTIKVHAINSLFKEENVCDEMSFLDTNKEMTTDKESASKSKTLPDQVSTSHQVQQNDTENRLQGKLIECLAFPGSVGDPQKSDISVAEFQDDLPRTEDSPVSCLTCHLTFRDANIAMLHQQLVHSQDHLKDSRSDLTLSSDNRNLSQKRWQSRSFLNHNRDFAESPHKYPCHVCNKVFRMRGSLMVHLRVAHSPNEKGLVPQPDCFGSSGDQGSPNIGNVPDHGSNLSLAADGESYVGKQIDITCSSGCIDNKLKGQMLFNQNNPFTVKETTIKNTSHEQVCNVSHQSSPNDSVSKEVHVSALSPSMSPTSSPSTQAVSGESVCMMYPCNHCNKTYSKEPLLTQHLKSHDSKQWECDVCFKSFTTKYFLKKHKRLHTGEMPYTCGICNKSFTFQQSYHKHLLYHSDEKPHSCSECGRAFKELSTLHNHQRIHTGEKPWACETCGKCFRQRVSYLVHRRIHTGAMPYQCTVCLKSFRYKVSQRTHKCITQPTEDASTQSADLLQQHLRFPKREEDSAAQSSISSELHGEPHLLLKDQLQHLDIKQENSQSSNLSKTLHESKGTERGHFLNKAQSYFQPEPNICDRAENQSVLVQRQSAQISEKPTGYHNAFSDLSQDGKHPSNFASSSSHESGLISEASINSCKQRPDITPNTQLLPSLESHGNVHTSVLSLPISQSSTSSSVEFSMDLFQDILSMVMSPENVSSPSTQMSHLSISGGVPSDSDLESGLDLQQLLYGSSDSGSTS